MINFIKSLFKKSKSPQELMIDYIHQKEISRRVWCHCDGRPKDGKRIECGVKVRIDDPLVQDHWLIQHINPDASEDYIINIPEWCCYDCSEAFCEHFRKRKKLT